MIVIATPLSAWGRRQRSSTAVPQGVTAGSRRAEHGEDQVRALSRRRGTGPSRNFLKYIDDKHYEPPSSTA